jgi:hypothetical protein
MLKSQFSPMSSYNLSSALLVSVLLCFYHLIYLSNNGQL